jgi:copper(I)-binding protein
MQQLPPLAAALSAMLALGILASATPASAAPATVTISDAWVRATVPQQKATGVFMQMQSIQEARLVEVRSPVAAVVEIHKMDMSDNFMQMRKVDGIDLHAGQAVDLKPGGYHIMLIDLKIQVKEGARVPLTLIVESKTKRRETIELQVAVRPLNSAATKNEVKQ